MFARPQTIHREIRTGTKILSNTVRTDGDLVGVFGSGIGDEIVPEEGFLAGLFQPTSRWPISPVCAPLGLCVSSLGLLHGDLVDVSKGLRAGGAIDGLLRNVLYLFLGECQLGLQVLNRFELLSHLFFE